MEIVKDLLEIVGIEIADSAEIEAADSVEIVTGSTEIEIADSAEIEDQILTDLKEIAKTHLPKIQRSQAPQNLIRNNKSKKKIQMGCEKCDITFTKNKKKSQTQGKTHRKSTKIVIKEKFVKFLCFGFSFNFV